MGTTIDFISRAGRRIKCRLPFMQRKVDKSAHRLHHDVLRALLSPHRTERVRPDYWEKRGGSDATNQQVVWRSPSFQTVEDKHVTYLSKVCCGKDVLDIGAGWGRMGLKLQNCCKSYKGLERSAKMLERGPNGLELIQGSGSQMPFPNETFDVIFMVICLSSMHDEVFRIYDEAMRCLRPKGIFIILEHNVTVIFEKDEYE